MPSEQSQAELYCCLFFLPLPLFPCVSWIFKCRGGLFEDGVLSCVPLGQHPLLLKLSELSPVVNAGEDFPHEDESQTNGNYGTDDPQDYSHDIHNNGTFFGFLDPDLQLSGLILVSVNKGEAAVIVVNKCTKSLVILNQVLSLLHYLRLEGTEAALVNPVLVLLSHQLAGAEDLTLDTGLELLALAGTGGTVLTVLPTVLTLLSLLTLALPALAGPMAGAELVDVLAVGGDAGLVTGPALTGGVALYVPL